MPDYTPVACSLHDRLESWAVRRKPVRVVWRDGDAERALEAVVRDVFARDGADWVALEGGPTVRADRLVSVDGVAFESPC